MEKVISIITEDGVTMFKQIDITNIKGEINKLLLVKTQDKEHLGIFCSYDNKWESINLKAVHQEVISFIKMQQITEIYKKI